jgi:hypothetical protein
MPHLMNCAHSEDWCLDCVKKMADELEKVSLERDAMREAIRSARLGGRLRGITTREMAAMMGITATQLCRWTGEAEYRPPDLVD